MRDAMDAASKVRLGRYVVHERIGVGGAGEVYRGELHGAEGFSRSVAIKRMRPELLDRPGARDELIAEAHLVRRLSHGNITSILDLGLDDAGVPYLVMELVDGVSLAELRRAQQAGSIEIAVVDAVGIVEEVAQALAYAHRSGGVAGGVVHRDVSPKNILVSRDGIVKLTDFGIARAVAGPLFTVPGVVKGTLGYLAPEQALGEAVDGRADQFALGVVLHELLGGDNPLAVATSVEQHVQLCVGRGIPRLDDVDGALADIVARAVAIDPADRFASMDELGAALEAWRVSSGLRRDPGRLAAAVARVADRRPGVAMAQLLGATRATRAVGPSVGPRRRTLPMMLGGLGLVAGIAMWLLVRPTRAPERQPVATPPLAGARAAAAREIDAGRQTALPAPDPDAGAGVSAVDAGRAERQARPGRRAPAARGLLKVNVVPWAEVTVDGEPVGATPVDMSVPAGIRTIVLYNPHTGRRVRHRVEVRPDRPTSITAW